MKTLAEEKITITMSRHEICDLMLAVSFAKMSSDGNKWQPLHDKLIKAIEECDENYKIKTAWEF